MSIQKRLLILDDEPDFATFVGTVAGDLGYEAIVTTTFAAFQAHYLADPPDVIVLDIVMPNQDGIETMQWLVTTGCCARIILISGFDPSYATAARVFGEHGGKMRISQMEKPVKLADLRARLQA